MAKGDHVYVKCSLGRIPFQHHGIDMGDGTFVHLAPDAGVRMVLRDRHGRFTVRRDALRDFCQGQELETVRHADRFSPDVVVGRAEMLVGRSGYSLMGGNCEHFASFCATGRAESRQIELGHGTLVAVASFATKAVWSITGKLSRRVGTAATAGALTKAAVRAHPLVMLADGVEVAALAICCAAKMDATRTRQVARLSSSVTAMGIGALLGGPAGAVVSLAAHNGSTLLAEKCCETARRALT